MHTRSLTHALVGAAAVVALAGCSPSATSLEPEPGEIDWDIAVTRASIQFGRPGGVEYNWWGHEAAVVRGDDAAPAVEDIITSGLDKMCAAVPSEDQAGPRGGFLVDVIALEAVAGERCRMATGPTNEPVEFQL